MELSLPEVPTLAVSVINLLAPYAVALVSSREWSASAKRLISVASSVALTLVALFVVYIAEGGNYFVESWWQLILVGVLISQTSYSLITKDSANRLEETRGIK